MVDERRLYYDEKSGGKVDEKQNKMNLGHPIRASFSVFVMLRHSKRMMKTINGSPIIYFLCSMMFAYFTFLLDPFDRVQQV
jgi:hypothetical protein